MNQYLRKSIRVTGYAGAALLLFVILFELNPFHFFGYMPTPADIKTPRMSVASELYTTDSVLIGPLF
jgi:penicillin-binding protein 1A